MRKALALATLVAALFAFGCAGSGMRTKSGAPITKQTVVKCPKCGAEFTIGEGLSTYEKSQE